MLVGRLGWFVGWFGRLGGQVDVRSVVVGSVVVGSVNGGSVDVRGHGLVVNRLTEHLGIRQLDVDARHFRAGKHR